MRFNKLILNSFVMIVSQLVTLFCSLQIKKYILLYLPLELLGVNAVFESFFSSLSYLDVGFSTLLVLYTYKSINTNKIEDTKKVLSIFKTIFYTIAIIITIISVSILPIIDIVFGIDLDMPVEVTFIYLIHSFSIISRYILLHKSMILSAYQKNYIGGMLSIINEIIIYFVKIILIITTYSYSVFLGLTVFSAFIVSMIGLIIADKQHPEYHDIKFATIKEVYDSNVIRDCIRYLPRALYGVVYYSMDNLIAVRMFGLAPLAFLSNYTMLFNTVDNFLNTISGAIQSSLASFAFDNNDKKNYLFVIDSINLVNIYVTALIAVGLNLLVSSFIGLYYGSEYIVNQTLVMVLVMNVVVSSYFKIYSIVFEIHGLMLKMKYPLLFSAFLNFLLSIYLGSKIGLLGIFLASVFATLIRKGGEINRIVKDVFFDIKLQFIKSFCFNLIILFILIIIPTSIINIISINSMSFIGFTINFVLIILLVTIIFLLITCKTRYFKYIYNEIINNIFKIKSL